MYEAGSVDFQRAEAERALKKSRVCRYDINENVQASPFTESLRSSWDDGKVQKAGLDERRNVIALSAFAGGSFFPLQVAYPQPCTSPGLPPSTAMAPTLPAVYHCTPYPCPQPEPFHPCLGQSSAPVPPDYYQPAFENVYIRPDGQTAYGYSSCDSQLGTSQNVVNILGLEQRSLSPAIQPRIVQQVCKKGEGLSNEVMLRLLITQSQASFLVRKEDGVVRLQKIRNHMKAANTLCEIKLYDDKGQNTEDHCLEIRGSCEGSPKQSACHLCLMKIVDVLLHEAKANTIRLAVPEGDQPGKLLGTKGACIAAIRKLSGASIKLAQDLGEVLDSESSIEGVVKGDRLLTIAGGSGAIMAAASDCAMKLVESQQGEASKNGLPLQQHSNPSSPSVPMHSHVRRGRSHSPTIPPGNNRSPNVPRARAQKRTRDNDSSSIIDLWITRQQKEILMGPKGSATKVIQQVRNDHTNVFLKLHDDSTTADQKRKLEFRGPSRHHIEAVKYDIDQQMKHGGQSPLPALKWDTGSESQ